MAVGVAGKALPQDSIDARLHKLDVKMREGVACEEWQADHNACEGNLFAATFFKPYKTNVMDKYGLDQVDLYDATTLPEDTEYKEVLEQAKDFMTSCMADKGCELVVDDGKAHWQARKGKVLSEDDFVHMKKGDPDEEEEAPIKKEDPGRRVHKKEDPEEDHQAVDPETKPKKKVDGGDGDGRRVHKKK